MFKLVSDESSQRLGIEVYKNRSYIFETSFLAGTVLYDGTHQSFTVSVGPNYTSMAEIAEETGLSTLSQEFDHARSHTILLGNYRTLDVADEAVTVLDGWYREVLKREGANKRLLVERGNEYVLASDEKASPLRYGEAIIRARNVQAFNMMRENKDLDYHTVVGKIMPIFLHALGLKEYHLSHDLSSEGNGAVKFILDKVGIFAFYKPQTEKDPAYFERYSYANGNYHRSFLGTTKGDTIRKFVFEWLADAAQERNLVLRDDYEQHLDEFARDIHRTWIQKEKEPVNKLLDQKTQIIRPDNIVSMAAFRPS